MREKSLRQLMQLRDELQAWLEQVGARFPTPDANHDIGQPSGRTANRPTNNPRAKR